MNIIVVCGNSTSGKTTIVSNFPKDYSTIYFDEVIYSAQLEFNMSIKNEFYTLEERITKISSFLDKIIFKATLAAPTKKVAIDYVLEFPKVSLRNLLPHAFYVLIYISPVTILERLIKRNTQDPRGIYALEQYAQIFKKALPGEIILGEVNKKELYDFITSNCKFFFNDETDLGFFLHTFFANLDIFDSETHSITVRNPQEFNLIIKADGLSVDSIIATINLNYRNFIRSFIHPH